MEHLARMQQVRQRVDDGDVRPLGELLDAVMAERADHDAVEVAREHARRVTDGFASPELEVTVREEKRLSAELVHARLKGDSRSRRGFLKNHAERLALENLVRHPCLLFCLEFLGECQDLLYLIHG